MCGYFFNFTEFDALGDEPTHYDFYDYLYYVDSIIRDGMISRYRSQFYGTIKELFYAYHQVMLITGRSDTPQFYEKTGSWIRILEDSEMCYDSYVKKLTDEPRFRQESYAWHKV